MTTATTQCFYSLIFCPMPADVHPEAVGINESTLAWAERNGLCDGAASARMIGARPGILSARVMPRGPRERVQVFADFHTWLFTFDDAYCDEGAPLAMEPQAWAAYLACLLRQAESGFADELPGNAHALALHDIGTRLAAYASPAQRSRWTEGLRCYFSALVWERRRRVGTVPLSLDDYLRLRLHNGAMQSSIALLDVAGCFEVPADVWARSEVRALREMTAVLVSWDNDLFSQHKDRQAGEDNLLLLLEAEQDLDAEAARLRAIALRNTVMDLFVRLSDRLTPDAEPALAGLLRSLGCWVRANLDFSRDSGRYSDPSRVDDPTAPWSDDVTALPTADLPAETRSWLSAGSR